MTDKIKKPELLAPAGDMERLMAAVKYGADAVYLGGTVFGMRAAPQNFSDEELKEAVDYCHERGVKVYLTCNVLPRNDELALLPSFCRMQRFPVWMPLSFLIWVFWNMLKNMLPVLKFTFQLKRVL